MRCLLLTTLGVCSIITCLCQGFTWARQVDSSGQSMQGSGGLAIDSIGNIFLVSNFTNSILVGGTTLQSKGGYDVALIKYDYMGNILWHRVFGGDGLDYAGNLHLDSKGNILMLGSFASSSIAFDNVVLNNADSYRDMFLTKIDQSGNVIWSKSKSGIEDVAGSDIDVDSNDNVYVAGIYDDPTSGKEIDFFLSKFDDKGDTIFNFNSTGTGLEFINGISVTKNNKIYIAGEFVGQLSFGSIVMNNSSANPASPDGFLIKLNANGSLVKATQIKGLGADSAYDIVTDSLDNAYVTGSFERVGDFGTLKLAIDSTRIPFAADIFIVKYDSSLNALWGRTSGSPQGFAWGSAIAMSLSGNIYVAGEVTSQFYSSEGTHISSCSIAYNCMIVEIDPQGNIKNLAKAGGPGWSIARYLCIDQNNASVITGEFYGEVKFGSTKLTSDEQNIFVSKLAAPPWGYLAWRIAADTTIDCTKPLSVNLEVDCSSFPDYDSGIGIVSIEISRLNSDTYFSPPYIIGSSSSSPIVCSLSDTLKTGKYFIRGLRNNQILDSIELNLKCKENVAQDPEADYNNIDIPNVFTPNNDGHNDSFEVPYDGLAKVYIEIYNRWGELIDAVSDGAKTWSGKNYSTGIYYYRVTIGKSIYKGWLSLAR